MHTHTHPPSQSPPPPNPTIHALGHFYCTFNLDLHFFSDPRVRLDTEVWQFFISITVMCGSHQPLKQSQRVHCTTTKSPSRWCLSCLLHSTLNKCSQRCSKTCEQFSIAQNTLWGRAAYSILNGHYNTSSTVTMQEVLECPTSQHQQHSVCFTMLYKTATPPTHPRYVVPNQALENMRLHLENEWSCCCTHNGHTFFHQTLPGMSQPLPRKVVKVTWSKLKTNSWSNAFPLSSPIHYAVSTRNVLPLRLLRHHLMALSFCRKWTSNFVFLLVGEERVWRRGAPSHGTFILQKMNQ